MGYRGGSAGSFFSGWRTSIGINRRSYAPVGEASQLSNCVCSRMRLRCSRRLDRCTWMERYRTEVVRAKPLNCHRS